MEEEDKIRDIPSYSELYQEIKGFELIYKLVVFLEKLGIKNEKLSKALEKYPELLGKLEMFNLPDRFNKYFAERGWIAYESINAELMEKAVLLGDEGKLDEAEQVLVDFYDKEKIKWYLFRNRGITAFRIREILAEKALDDYSERRYHASVPLVLMIMDGVVNDIEQTGFFAENTDLSAWDSIAGHSTGLKKLSALMRKGVNKTVTDEIQIPYRHGILHGRYINYANKLAAAKAWAALFAIGDWARALEAEKKRGPEDEQKEKSWREIFETVLETKRFKEKIAAWEPRALEIGKDMPATGDPDDYEDDSPERAVVAFLFFWMKGNYGKMAELIRDPGSTAIRKLAGDVRFYFQEKTLERFEIGKVSDEAPAITEITVGLFLIEGGNKKAIEYKFRLIFESDVGKPVVHGDQGGKWRIVNWIVF